MEKLFATLVIFSFFLLKWNYGKLGDRHAIFPCFEYNRKNETTARMNIIFSLFRFSILEGKWKNRKMSELGIEDYFIFLTFQTISKIKNSKISLLDVHTVLCIFEEDFIIRKMKKYQFF